MLVPFFILSIFAVTLTFAVADDFDSMSYCLYRPSCRRCYRICWPLYINVNQVWDYETGECERTLKGHTNVVQGVAFSPDGQMMASCGADTTVKVTGTIG